MATSLVNQKDPGLYQKRLPTLKDFLRDDCYDSCSSSSNGFQMYTRKLPCKPITPVPSKSRKNPMVLLRSGSRKAAATTVSTIHKVIRLVLGQPGSATCDSDVGIKVKIKDILKWKSFRDLAEEGYNQHMDFSSLRHLQCTTTTTTASTTTSCSRRSSWCDSDFTADDYSPLCCGENEEILDKKSKGCSLEDHDDQQSPVSVLECTIRENKDYFSPLHDATKMSSNGTFKEVEEEMDFEEGKLFHKYDTEPCLVNTFENKSDYLLILDIFMEEVTTNKKLDSGYNQFDFDGIMMGSKSWLSEEFKESYEWEVQNKRGAFVRDMENGIDWKKFTLEKEEILKELEDNVWNDLMLTLLNEVS